MTRHDLAEEWRWPAETILPRPLERLAGVEVRPSTLPQVRAPQASTRRPYRLVRRAVALGWADARGLVLDEELGRAGTRVEGRHGVPRLVAAVGLDQVGLSLGGERSRLARASNDGHPRLESCALGGTRLADLDGSDEPSPDHERVWRGLQGPLREAARHRLTPRRSQGTLQQARRGARSCPLPRGEVWTVSGAVVCEPDEPVPHGVRLVCRTFDVRGTLPALWRDLVQHESRLGGRVRAGPAKGTLEWRRPHRRPRPTLVQTPRDAGASAYGRRPVEPRHKQAGRPPTGRLTRRRQDAQVVWRAHVPAYLTGPPYAPPLGRLAATRARAETLAAVRHGPALRAGLLVCGRCGHRLQVREGGPRPLPSATGHRLATTDAGDDGPDRPGGPVDTCVRPGGLNALAPAALTVSWAAATPLERARQERDRRWPQRLARAPDATERAARHDRLVDPAHRLVARPRAQDWEETRTAQRPRQEADDRCVHEPPVACPARRGRPSGSWHSTVRPSGRRPRPPWRTGTRGSGRLSTACGGRAQGRASASSSPAHGSGVGRRPGAPRAPSALSTTGVMTPRGVSGCGPSRRPGPPQARSLHASSQRATGLRTARSAAADQRSAR